jgi:hypothetical protein
METGKDAPTGAHAETSAAQAVTPPTRLRSTHDINVDDVSCAAMLDLYVQCMNPFRRLGFGGKGADVFAGKDMDCSDILSDWTVCIKNQATADPEKRAV